MPSKKSDEPVRLIEDPATGDRFLIYGTDKGIKVELRYEGDQLWLTQSQIADLFGRERSVVSKHIKNIIEEGEVPEECNVQKMHIASSDKPAAIYNLNMIISVGYRVSSKQATMFRIWATDKLVQFATKGFVVDAERLKTPDAADRVVELREILKDIRSDEANVYREVRAICATCRDYDPKSKAWRDYYARMQAKIVYAVTSMTPSMIVVGRANAAELNMGLQTWPGDRIRQEDVTTSKNYLARSEIEELNRLTTLLLDYLDDQLKSGRIAMMADAETHLDTLVRTSGRVVLHGGGTIKTSVADGHAKKQFDIYRERLKELRHREADRHLANLVDQTNCLPKQRPKKKPG